MLVGNAGSAFPSFVIGPVLILVFAILLKWLPAGGWNGFSSLHGPAGHAAHDDQRGDRGPRDPREPDRSDEHELHPDRVRQGLVALDGRVSPCTPADPDSRGLGYRSARDRLDHGGGRHRVVFSLPGIGKLIVNGAANRDYTLVLGLVVLVTVVAVLLNLLVDLAYAWLDPKIRY